MTEPHTNRPPSHEELRSFLDQYGIQPGLSPEAREKRLMRIMKSKRTRQLARVNEQYVQGRVSLQLIIDCLQSPEEANLFCSISHDSAATIGGQLYELMAPHLHPGCTIADLGCYTGGFAAWLAAKHPECRVLGFDCHEKAVCFARQLATDSNISFNKWDYQRENPPDIGPVDLLTCSCGIDLGIIGSRLDDAPLGSFSLDVMHLRESGAYRAFLDKVRPCFSSWRAIAKAEGRLWTVLRLVSIESFLAVVDAAREAGWMLDLAASHWIVTDERPFPLLAFVARNAEIIDDEVLVAWFGHAPAFDPEEYPGATPHLDVLRYRGLATRVITAARDFQYLDGHTMRVEVGTTGDQAYVFHRATYGFTQLQFITPEQAGLIQLESISVEQLPIRFECPL